MIEWILGNDPYRVDPAKHQRAYYNNLTPDYLYAAQQQATLQAQTVYYDLPFNSDEGNLQYWKKELEVAKHNVKKYTQKIQKERMKTIEQNFDYCEGGDR